VKRTYLPNYLTSHPRKTAAISTSKFNKTFFPYRPVTRSQGSSDGTVTGYRWDDGKVGVRVPVGSRIFSSPRRPERLWGSPSLLSNEYRALSPKVKRPEREADHLPPTSAKVK
jgi:hypothetical protein